MAETENKETINEESTKVETKATTSTPKEDTTETPSTDEQVASLRLELAKMKRALDKSSSETASYKKQLRERQSADEIQAQEKAEREAQREEQFQALVRENTVNKYSKGFMALGYPEDLAEQASIAQYDGDTDALFQIQKKVMEQKEKSLRADLMKTMPVSPISNDGEDTDAFLLGFSKK